MLKTLFTHLLFRKDEMLILDMYAGVEHLGRATVDFVDALIIVVEPTRRSFVVAKQIKILANDIGLDRLWIIGNKIRNPDDLKFIRDNSLNIPLLGSLPINYSVQEADRLGISVYSHVPELRNATELIADKIAYEIQSYQESGVNE